MSSVSNKILLIGRRTLPGNTAPKAALSVVTLTLIVMQTKRKLHSSTLSSPGAINQYRLPYLPMERRSVDDASQYL